MPSRDLLTATAVGLMLVCLTGNRAAPAESAESRLRLIPFPREVRLTRGRFSLPPKLVLWLPSGNTLPSVREGLAAELTRRGRKLELRRLPSDHGGNVLFLTPATASAQDLPPSPIAPQHSEGYALAVAPAGAAAAGADPRGLFYAAQTLRQLLRANVHEQALACLTIRDYPALRYRGFQDDITRGPSPLLTTLTREVEIGAAAKMNFFTYYLEHQFAFRKHPEIGPPDGSLTPAELKALVAHGARHNMEIIGCQQSFGHFYQILKHDQFKDLRETGGLLSPVNEGSYKLLDDLYSEQAPLTSSPFFNVCCDETYGLGTGPAKELTAKLGVGGVYARHLRRLHDLLKEKYGKRMMMWGDIILQHPDDLEQIPKDTVMLTWGYGPAASFESQIIPFAKSGYDFFVCPGVNCWSRQLPDFAAATINIHNFVRDGVKHGALGMLNTTWDDDGENFFAPNWPGVLWGAECAWTGATTDPHDFYRRLGGVLLGEPGDEFGQALELLSRLHALPGYQGMRDQRFWQLDLGKAPTSVSAARRQAQALLDLTRPALRRLHEARKTAVVNADLVDYFLFGAERIELMATRWLDFLKAAAAYDDAVTAVDQPAAARRHIESAVAILKHIRDQHAELRRRYEALWKRENKPFALDRVLSRFDRAIAAYDSLAQRVAAAANAVAAGKPLPAPATVGLAVTEMGVRSTRPVRKTEPLASALPWQETQAVFRCGLTVAAGETDRRDVPLEVNLALPTGAGLSGRLYQVVEGEQRPAPCQLDEVADETGARHPRLTFLLPAPLPAGQTARFYFYAGAPPAQATPPPLRWEQAKGGYWIENEFLKLFVGKEGGHVYHWIVKPSASTGDSAPAEGVDLTQPGTTGWAGFADLGGTRRAAMNELQLVQAGPVLARVRCVDPLGQVKTISLFAGQPWVECTLESPVGWFWNYDDPGLLSAEGKLPARYLFSTGAAGAVGKNADGAAAQVKRTGAFWSAKFAPGRLLLALITPEVKARHVVGPGGGWGGVGLEGSAPVSHLVIYGGRCPPDPAATLNRLRQNLDFTHQPTVALFAWERKKG